MRFICVCVAVVVLGGAALAAKGKTSAAEVRGQGKVRYVPYFRRRAKGSDKVIQFYRAVYPADYSDLSKYKEREVEEMAARAEGPEDTPIFVELGEDSFFGRSRECRETTLLDQGLAGECAWADLRHLGFRRITLYTAWNSFVYIYRILMFFVIGVVVYKLLMNLGPAINSMTRPLQNPRISNISLMTMLNSAITDNIPGIHTEGGDTSRWNPEQREVLQRLRLKAYYNFLSLIWNRRY